MADRISIVPDSGEQEVKLNFSSLLAFLSSLDYLRFLELSGAFRSMNSTDLYYTQERVGELPNFIMKHVLLWVNLAYIMVLFAGYWIMRDKFVLFAVVLSLFYFFGGIWFVNRYCIGRGYLYQVARDFLMWVTVFTMTSWFIWDTIIFWLVPRLYRLFVAWLFDPSSQVGTINKLLYPTALYIYKMIAPHVENLFGMKGIIVMFWFTAPIKVFALMFPLIYFVVVSKLRKSVKEDLDRKLRKLA